MMLRRERSFTGCWTVTLPGLVECFSWTWSPLVATSYQPSCFRRFRTSRLLIIVVPAVDIPRISISPKTHKRKVIYAVYCCLRLSHSWTCVGRDKIGFRLRNFVTRFACEAAFKASGSDGSSRGSVGGDIGRCSIEGEQPHNPPKPPSALFKSSTAGHHAAGKSNTSAALGLSGVLGGNPATNGRSPVTGGPPGAALPALAGPGACETSTVMDPLLPVRPALPVAPYIGGKRNLARRLGEFLIEQVETSYSIATASTGAAKRAGELIVANRCIG